FCHHLFLIGFAQSKNGCTLTVPPNTVPHPVFIAIHDFERGYRALVPVFNLAQDSINILGHREIAQGRIGDRYRVWRNLVGEIGPGCSPRDCVGFEGDFVPHMPEPKAEFQRGASGASAFRSASPSVSQNCLRSPGRPQERLKAEQGQERKGYVTSVSYCTYII